MRIGVYTRKVEYMKREYRRGEQTRREYMQGKYMSGKYRKVEYMINSTRAEGRVREVSGVQERDY